MKKLFTLIAALLFAATVWAQSSSPKMSYQAVVRNAANELVTNKTDIAVTVTISDGTNNYTEIHTVTSNQNGLISLFIGDGTVQPGSADLNDIDWKNAKIATSINLGEGELVSATVPVTAVPYALYAESVNPNSEIINNIQGNITEIQGDITEIKENYLTKAGLCDSIMSCPTITEIQGDITTIQSNVTNLTDNYLTKAGLCDSIKNCPTITEIQSNISEIKGDINNLTDDYLTKAGLCDSIKSCPTITEIQGNITNLTNNYLTKAGLCDSIKNCPTITDIQGDITEITENYLTKAGLCDSIKNCPTITDIQGDITEIKGNVTNLTENYLTIDGLCDSIKNKCTDIATITTVQNAIHDSIVNKISAQISDSLKHITIPDITGMLTCDNVETECDKIAIKTAENIFSKKNTFSDTLDATDAGSAIIVNSVVNNGAIAATDSSRVVNAKDLANYVANTVVDTMKYAKFSATAEQNEFTVPVATGSTIITDYRFVEFFINGVFVGTSEDGVVTVSGDKVTYVPAENDNYELVAGDRIQIIYWVKNN